MVDIDWEEFPSLPEPARRRTAASALSRVRAWLKVADLEQPEPVVDFRAEVVEIAKRSKSLYLGPETLLDLQEIARRCERWIAEAIKLGQRQHRIRDRGHRRGGTTVSPESVAKQSGSGSLSAYYAIFDNIAEAAFEEAVAISRRQGTLAQAPLQAVIADLHGPVPRALANRRARIASLAAANHTSRQISQILGLRMDLVNRIADQAGICIIADAAVTKKSHRIDPRRVVGETINTLEGLAMGLGLIHPEDYDDLDPLDVADWIGALNKVLPTITAMKKELLRVYDRDER